MITPELFRRYSSNFVLFCEDAIIPTERGPVRFGDVMHLHQRRIIEEMAPMLLAVATGQVPARPKLWAEMSKSWGKGLMAALAVIWLMLFARIPRRIQVAASDQDQADEIHRWIRGILACWSLLANTIETPNYRAECKATGCDTEILAADVQGSHGAVGVNLLILDELHAVSKWQFIENLADNGSKSGASVVCLTNAGFKSHPAWRWREIARTSPRWSFHQVCEPPPWVAAAEIEEAARRNSTERFRRLWYGVWSSGAGDALDSADIVAAIDRNLRPLFGSSSLIGNLLGWNSTPGELPQNVTFLAGLDIGVRHDHSGLVVLGADHTSHRVRLAYAESWAPDKSTGKVDLIAVKQCVSDCHRRFRLHKLLYDPSQAELMAMELHRDCHLLAERMTFTGSNLNLMATTLLEVFRSRCIVLYPHDRLVADLRRLTIVERQHGQYRLEATSDAEGHADVAVALACALPAAVSLASNSYGPGSVITLAIDPRGFDPTRESRFAGGLRRYSIASQ
jgi:hypothetical protein